MLTACHSTLDIIGIDDRLTRTHQKKALLRVGGVKNFRGNLF